ncbi:Ldh family oxidoreductase [Jiangella asiatica]|uniref:Ldh family oxidoreductase n=1 Tax=Jiangella asiatica TaxID=2530372 RepID=A0A4R5DEE7_9ACTN|nr:Ldh family oxidoreductase [Jiangella asiatica]TDE10104.1 Ldh family oxidoreductase [Jiangella asiatica]
MIAVGTARDLAASALRAAGVPADKADRTAQLLVTADVWGVGSHGLMRLPRYLARLAAGGLRADAELTAVRTTGPVVAFDGHDGLGHWQLWDAAAAAAERAARYGVAAASVGNSSHCGALGLYTAPALRRGLVSLVFSTGPAVMAPPGTATPLLSTSPLAAGVPGAATGTTPGSQSGGHTIVDLATSAVARGRIAAAARRGEPLPAGWAVDTDGLPTTDAAAALTGMLAPMGGAKGFALAFLVEALAGAAVGPALATGVPDMFDAASDTEPQRIGHLVITLDPALVDVDGGGPDRLARLRADVTAAGGRVPGAGKPLPWEIDPDAVVDIADDVIAELRSWPGGDTHAPPDGEGTCGSLSRSAEA